MKKMSVFLMLLFIVGCSGSQNYQNDIDIAYKLVILDENNGYQDRVIGGVFERSSLSGAGTGRFIAKNFEFHRGNCQNLTSNSIDWVSETAGCGSKLIGKSWCIRNVYNTSINYTVKFISWTSGTNQICTGNCSISKNETAYYRSK